MLEPDQWDAVLSTITGQVYRGTERIASAMILNALGVGQNPEERQRAGKRIVSSMRRYGWTGPKQMRVDSQDRISSGYWRLPRSRPPVLEPLAPEPTADEADDLPHALEDVTRLGLKEMKRILRLPLDESNGALMRTKATVAIGAVNAQLRADEQRLRAKVRDDTLERLLRAIEKERPKIVEGGAGEAEAFSLADLSDDRAISSD